MVNDTTQISVVIYTDYMGFLKYEIMVLFLDHIGSNIPLYYSHT